MNNSQIEIFCIHLGNNVGYTGLIHLLVKRILDASSLKEYDCSINILEKVNDESILSINLFQINDLLLSFKKD